MEDNLRMTSKKFYVVDFYDLEICKFSHILFLK